MVWVQKLQLTNFRCYETVHLDDLSSGPVVLYGANGAGKTNILEAVSLLAPGRGLRGAKISEMQKIDSCRNTQPWAISSVVETSYGAVRIGTGAEADKERRQVRINGEAVKGQSALAEYLACVWLTPQMDRLFLEGSSARRRFLDRLIFAFDASHTGRLTRYDNAMSQRSKILKEHEHPDPSWLEGLEANMAETGVAIAAARLDFIQRLQNACDQAGGEIETHFPRSHFYATGTIEEQLMQMPAVEVEELFKYQLRQSRDRDAVTGGSVTGVHRSDLSVTYADKNMPAAQCSTGEQKALLIGIILAHSRLVAAEKGSPPLLLLDEVAAHLDETRRCALYERLLSMGSQVWMTGTDKSLFNSLENRGQCFEIASGAILQYKNQSAA